MGKNADKLKEEVRSLSFRMPMLFVLSGVLIMLIIIPIVYYRFQQRMINQYTRMAQGVTNLMAQVIDAERDDEYLEKKFELPEYIALLRQFQNLKESYPDIIFMHVYRYQEDGGSMIFDLNDPGDGQGMVHELSPAFKPYLDQLRKGAQIPAITEHTKYGYLLSYVRPVFDDKGNYQCHACVSFSMDFLHEQDANFIISIIGILSIAVAVILLIDIELIRWRITGPINRMVHHIKEFRYDTEEDRFHNVQIMEALNITSKDEIQDLYQEFVSVMKESLYYMTNLNRAKNDIQSKENEIGQISAKAFKDVMTGVGNPAAYEKAKECLAKELSDHKTRFAIVMADINNLKYINDTFGHEIGDQYIRGCCAMICGTYKHSPVYRVGGDEFVVILKNEDYASRTLRLTKIREAFVGTYNQKGKEDWERYSASIGMAEALEEDTSVEQVLKRADEAMYEEKMAFKKKYGSYR